MKGLTYYKWRKIKLIYDQSFLKKKGLMKKLLNIFDIKKLVNDNEYRKKHHIKKYKPKDGLNLFRYDKSFINDSNLQTLGQFRSVITDGIKIILAK